MKYVTKVQTADGVIHDTVEAASKHLDKKFGDIIVPIAHELVHIDKYSRAHEFIERHLDDFAKLIAIRADALSKLSPPEVPDDE